MIRFLTIAVCSLALLLGLLQVATRYTITVTVRPSGAAAPVEAPREIPAEAPAVDVGAQPKAKTGRAKIDSHHTKGA